MTTRPVGGRNLISSANLVVGHVGKVIEAPPYRDGLDPSSKWRYPESGNRWGDL
jgi:hypothetical protein